MYQFEASFPFFPLFFSSPCSFSFSWILFFFSFFFFFFFFLLFSLFVFDLFQHLYRGLTKEVSFEVGWDWVGPPAWEEQASTLQSGVGAPRLLKRSLPRLYYCCCSEDAMSVCMSTSPQSCKLN